MKLKLGKHVVSFEKLENQQFVKSMLTDKDLHTFSASLKVKETMLDDFKKILENSEYGGVYSLDNDNNVVKEYCVASKGYGYQDCNSNEEIIYSYNLYFKENESMNLDYLEISGLIIKPYKFEQEYNDGITIIAYVTLTKDEMKELKGIHDKKEYFDVIRHGISDKVTKMRFGQNIWSENDDSFKVKLRLVEQCYDAHNNNNIGLFEPEMSNIQYMLAYQTSLNNELINLLLDKSIFSEKELSIAKDNARKNLQDTYRLFRKVKDIDKF